MKYMGRYYWGGSRDIRYWGWRGGGGTPMGLRWLDGGGGNKKSYNHPRIVISYRALGVCERNDGADYIGPMPCAIFS